ncbi:hypothetical protein [Leifsonia virtsii]|uniref:Abi-like protein n=1 Tax=Leifsonia virtsii TaxID=3035915 RepID=A0ABT8IT58_9MICO|nr:hypothetical protein [Leifsonia virtsii]MDN4595942.1 hypothetical protein [Leifsonia virtsii]
MRALELYRANAQISGVAHAAVHYFEVMLRNALDRELRTWNQSVHGTPEWAFEPGRLLASVIPADRLRRAGLDAARAVRGRRRPTHDDVIAQITFGVWRNLLPSKRHRWKQALWDEALQHAFANRQGVRVDQIARSVAIVSDFRNRIAHHEPVFALDLRGKRKAMRDVLNSISPTARRWFVEHEPLSPALDDFYADWPEFARTN